MLILASIETDKNVQRSPLYYRSTAAEVVRIEVCFKKYVELIYLRDASRDAHNEGAPKHPPHTKATILLAPPWCRNINPLTSILHEPP